MKAVPKKELIAILVRTEEEILFKEQIIVFFDNLGDDYYCVDGNIELSKVNKVREELIRHL